MPTVRVTALAVVTTLGCCQALAQPTPTTATPVATAQGKPYDLVANCLMRQMAGRQFAAWPLVYAPPRQEALVNLWLRGREHEAPVGTFRVVQDLDGTTRISFQGTQGAPGPSMAAVEAAAKQCAR
ncbi:MAG TPA: hypothetical protein VJR58_34405 [Vineibacter sp.]|nr:hypothetical protein [Vineibacter sp.]